MDFIKDHEQLKAIKTLKACRFNHVTPDCVTIKNGFNALDNLLIRNGATFMDIAPDGIKTFQPRGVMFTLAEDALAGENGFGLNRRDLMQIKYTDYDYYYFNVYEHVEIPNAKNILRTLGGAVDYLNQETMLKNKLD